MTNMGPKTNRTQFSLPQSAGQGTETLCGASTDAGPGYLPQEAGDGLTLALVTGPLML